ncbi:secondary thiamine-phosphate synthase enzyme YjbQ [Oceaniserpentilla sp. 4NH20-0058]|uniref:secondary thiamine-phosphate synthase enzyme YjbQ n=1 Tax=Oceaniserpentilla sp. 4NH20-0058 TaxID=3127660 RepID=UPI00310577D9
MWQQKTIHLAEKPRGFHLITEEVLAQLPEIKNIKIGLVHLLLQHTSAGLTLNENADPTVREDFLQYINRLAPEDLNYLKHTYEGDDDMPAHLKSSLLGVELMLPITQGQLNLGVWQGIYLGEYRNFGGVRQLIVTIQS